MPRKARSAPAASSGAKAKPKTARKPKTAQKATTKPQKAGKAKGKGKTAGKANATPKAVLKAAEGIEPETVSEEPQKHAGGRPTKYRPEFAQVARVMCSMGATDAELADAFDVTVQTIWRWQSGHQEFCYALKVDKGEYDDRIKRSLAQRALGYTYDAVKIFMPAGAEEPVYAKYREHVPPDPGAAKIWLCNRQPAEWREKQTVEHDLSDGLVALLGAIDGNGASLF